MVARIVEPEESRIEQISMEAEMLIEKEDARRDLKESRGIRKAAFYDGSQKLKHLMPKGKHL